MPEWNTGDRVAWQDSVNQRGEGMVVGDARDLFPLADGAEAIYRDLLLVCRDRPFKPSSWLLEPGDADKYTGKNHAKFAKRNALEPAKGPGNYFTLPPHIKVFMANPLNDGSYEFRAGITGRLIQCDNENGPDGNTWATVQWSRDVVGQFRTHRAGGKQFPNCWSIPAEYLRWVTEGRSGPRVWDWAPYIKSPPLKRPRYQPYSFVIYAGPSGGLIGSNDHRSFPISSGTILQILGDRGRYYDAITVSGCQQETIGLSTQVGQEHLSEFPFPYFPEGTAVEIKADLFFKRKNLRGRTGVVILPTDSDGDVGIELPEDLGAGSLDGHGREGCCLYVPISTLINEESE